MPVAHYTLPDHNFLITVVSGMLTDEEVSQAVRQLMREGTVDPGFRELVDCRELAVTPRLTHDGVVGGAELERMNDLCRGSPLVFVTPTDVAFGLARAYTSMVESHRGSVQVVRSLDSAIAWLNAEDIRSHILSVVPPDPA